MIHSHSVPVERLCIVSALSVRHLYTGSQNVLSNSVRAVTCVNTSMPCLASRNFCHSWSLPIFLPGACNLCLASGSLSWLLSRQLSYQRESGLVTLGPCCFVAVETDRSGLVLCIGKGLLPETGPSVDVLVLSLRLERPGRGPREGSHLGFGPNPSTVGLCPKPTQGPS